MAVTGARLVGGPEASAAREGRLEVEVDGKWGAVCNRNESDIAAANVACHSLGFLGAAAARGQGYYGASPEPPALQILRCTGQEAGLGACTTTRAIDPECNKTNAFGVWCQGAARLVLPFAPLRLFASLSSRMMPLLDGCVSAELHLHDPAPLPRPSLRRQPCREQRAPRGRPHAAGWHGGAAPGQRALGCRLPVHPF